MDLSEFGLYKLTDQNIDKPFDCGDEDLNSFLKEKAVFYSQEALASTFILEKNGNIAAYFSIFNDSIKVEESNFPSRSAYKRQLKSMLSHPKRHLRELPAIKIGRLAVSKEVQTGGLGKIIIDYIKQLAIDLNKISACKYISVDAYEQSLGFYQKMGFEFFTETDAGKDTRQMYFDVTPLINTQQELDKMSTS